MNTIFWMALEIAWSDGSMSKKGALIIEELHDAMGLDLSLREEIEEKFEEVEEKFEEVVAEEKFIEQKVKDTICGHVQTWFKNLEQTSELRFPAISQNLSKLIEQIQTLVFVYDF